MKTALIPPRGLENYALQSDIHLMLAIPSLLARTTYSNLYRRARRLGQYIILDNGANEGTPAPWTWLLDVASEFGVNEVVAPDELRHCENTIRYVQSFVRQPAPVQAGVKIMAVVQGINMNEFKRCALAFSDLDKIEVIGVPRHMLTTLRSQTARIDLVRWLQERLPKRFQIHLLGTNSSWPGEVKAVAKYLGEVVRSVDTSLPFNYALANTRLQDPTARYLGIDRPKDYFESDWGGKANLKLVRDNVATFLDWTHPAAEVEDASEVVKA